MNTTSNRLKKSVFILLSCVFFITVKAETQLPVMRTKPYLQNPTGGGMTVSWLTNSPVHSWVEYGTNPEHLDQRAEVWLDGQVLCYNTQHMIRLSDLTPNITYYYRVCSREITLYQAYKKEFGRTEYSDIHSFKTPGDKTTDFTALVFNDLHKSKDMIDNLMSQVEGSACDLVFFNGDCIDDPKDEDSVVDYLSYLNEKVGAETRPVFYIRGNHEIRNAYSIKLRDLIDYVGGNTTYGAFNWGDTRFVLLDCGEDKPDTTWVYYGLNSFETFRKEQAEFLEKEVQSKDFKKASERIVIHHIPVYGFKFDYLPCRELWHPIFEKAGFSLAINGHVHRFSYTPKHQDRNNFPVVIGGGPSAGRGTVMILRKRGNELTLEVLDDTGKQLLKQVL